MNIAFCYDSVLPRMGGCETYIANLARRLAADRHELHLYARRWDESALPTNLHYHRISVPGFPRFLRPWFFTSACLKQLLHADHDVTVGFDKIAGLDVFYPQGGVHAAAVDFNLLKHRRPLVRRALKLIKWIDPAHISFRLLEEKLFSSRTTMFVAISDMVSRHMEDRYGVGPAHRRVLRIATPPERFDETDRPKRRHEMRLRWRLASSRVTALFVGMNPRLKGLEPLLRAMQLLKGRQIDLLVVGRSRMPDFERQARRLDVQSVRFAGYCSDMRDAYFAADLLVHPTFYDPCANVVLEALACGLPVITTSNNGASELMHPIAEGGICAEGLILDDPHDHVRLSWCLEEMLDPERRRRCSQAARRTAQTWTFEDHYRGLLAILCEAAARKRHAA
jgi:UDP-glucose:(heptosyl)LPS alpha-1,3-glucosyltransferase